MVGWYYQLNVHESEQTPGDREGQGTLVCCSPWGCSESDTTWQLNNDSFDCYDDQNLFLEGKSALK